MLQFSRNKKVDTCRSFQWKERTEEAKKGKNFCKLSNNNGIFVDAFLRNCSARAGKKIRKFFFCTSQAQVLTSSVAVNSKVAKMMMKWKIAGVLLVAFTLQLDFAQCQTCLTKVSCLLFENRKRKGTGNLFPHYFDTFVRFDLFETKSEKRRRNEIGPFHDFCSEVNMASLWIPVEMFVDQWKIGMLDRIVSRLAAFTCACLPPPPKKHTHW